MTAATEVVHNVTMVTRSVADFAQFTVGDDRLSTGRCPRVC
jgi:hypothetical protein